MATEEEAARREEKQIGRLRRIDEGAVVYDGPHVGASRSLGANLLVAPLGSAQSGPRSNPDSFRQVASSIGPRTFCSLTKLS